MSSTDRDLETLLERAEDLYQSVSDFIHTAETGERWAFSSSSTLSDEEREELDRASDEAWEEPRSSRRLSVIAKRAIAISALVAAFAALGAIWSDYRDETTLDAGARSLQIQHLPQDGAVLGDKEAPKAFIYIDPAGASAGELFEGHSGRALREAVRRGDVKLQLSPLVGDDPSGAREGRAILAAASQDQAWSVGSVLINEDQSWTSDQALLDDLKASGLSLNFDKLGSSMMSGAIDNQLAKVENKAMKLGVSVDEPVIVIDQGDDESEIIPLSELDAGSLKEALNVSAERGSRRDP